MELVIIFLTLCIAIETLAIIKLNNQIKEEQSLIRASRKSLAKAEELNKEISEENKKIKEVISSHKTRK